MSDAEHPDDWLQDRIARPSDSARRRARARQQQLTKPPGSLGRLETLAVELAAMQHCDRPRVDTIHIGLFAADHGIAARGVSAYPQAVTTQMLANFAAGGAAINALANSLGARLELIDVGTLEAPPPGVIDARIAAGTHDISERDAMDATQLQQALDAGRDAVERALADHAQLFIGGEMGIGNSSAASALSCALLNREAARLVGPGTGLDDHALAHKTTLIEQALARHAGHALDPFAALRAYGGFEIAALSGACLRCAQRGLPMLIDGFIVTAAALAAVRIDNRVRDWLLFSHASAEPGHGIILKALDADPLLSLDMRLGEASGAACAANLLRMACAIHNHMATFEDAGVSETS